MQTVLAKSFVLITSQIHSCQFSRILCCSIDCKYDQTLSGSSAFSLTFYLEIYHTHLFTQKPNCELLLCLLISSQSDELLHWCSQPTRGLL